MEFKKFIQKLIDEFEENEYWETNYDRALDHNDIDGMYDVGRYECLTGIMREIENLSQYQYDIDRTVTVELNPDDMEMLNISTGIDAFATDNWVDYSTFVEVKDAITLGDDTKTDIKKFVSKWHLDLLKKGLIDYIVFRLDC